MCFSGLLCVALWNPPYSGSRPQEWIVLPSSVEKAPLLIMEKERPRPPKTLLLFPIPVKNTGITYDLLFFFFEVGFTFKRQKDKQ